MENTPQIDFRALCAELLDELDMWSSWHDAPELKARVKEALAQPEPVEVTDQELLDAWEDCKNVEPDPSFPKPIIFARTVLQRWGRPAIIPIPVSERLPRPEDCDAEGRCWYFSFETVIGGANWQLFTEEEQEGFIPPTHWLPASALPLPEVGAV